mmetsp:Transcript_10766/g.20445  ORF Transcript_10766/g.20445 Transcript_10766/m.20445 type:complete len:98 (+) Transcript_10766:2211-2504(+)
MCYGGRSLVCVNAIEAAEQHNRFGILLDLLGGQERQGGETRVTRSKMMVKEPKHQHPADEGNNPLEQSPSSTPPGSRWRAMQHHKRCFLFFFFTSPQ